MTRDLWRLRARAGDARTRDYLNLLGSVLAVAVVGFIAAWLIVHRYYPGDAVNYFTAGDRLNHGQSLYAPLDLGQGPGYAAVAIFSPPLAGVLFRPIAALPWDLAIPAWVWIVGTIELGTILMLARRQPLAGIAITILGLAIMLAVLVGNLDCLVLAMCVLAYLRLEKGHEAQAGILLGIAASLKLTPLALVFWLFAAGHRRAGYAAVATGIVLAVVAMLGSSPDIFVQFTRVIVTNYGGIGGGAGPLSLSTIAASFGVPSALAVWLPRLALVSGFLGVVALRQRPAWAWAVATATMVFASPTVGAHAYALLLIAFAAFPSGPVVERPGGAGGDGATSADPGTLTYLAIP